MMLLIEGRREENQDVKIHFPTLKGGFYLSPWFALNSLYENDNFFFLEGLGDEEIRLSTMLEF